MEKTTPILLNHSDILPSKVTASGRLFRAEQWLESSHLKIHIVSNTSKIYLIIFFSKLQEDVDLRGMSLDLDITEASWIRLNEEKQMLEGLLWDVDPPKTYQYTLTAIDANGGRSSSSYDLELSVRVPLGKATHMFTVSVDEKFSDFANTLSKQLMMYERLSKVFNGSVITFESVKPGSVLVGYSVENNDVISGRPNTCRAVKRLTRAVFDSDDKVSDRFLSSMKPYKVKAVTFIPLGDCKDSLSGMEVVILNPGTGEGREDEEMNILFIILPIVAVVVIIIIIIIIIVCIRRRRQRSMEVSKNGTYIEKGVPVRFEEEMKDMDKKESLETQPLMEESAKPQPPAYPQNGKETTPLNGGGESTAETYQPPTPPVSEHDDADKS